MPGPRSRRFFPEVVTGYPLVNFDIQIVTPSAATNVVLNPSLERDTTGWSAAGAAVIARSTAWQRRGAYALAVTPTAGLADGAFYGTVPLTGGTLYAMSVDILGAAGVPYALYFANTIAQRQSPLFTFTGTGRAQRPVLNWQPPATSNYRCYMVKNFSASTKVFYLDGLQVELAPASTYIDGDQRGFIVNQAAYFWNAQPHASASTRVLATRAGGVEVSLSKYGFSLLAVMGLGLTGFINQFTANAALGGSQYDGTLPVEHVFDLLGAITGRSHLELQHNRSNLERLLRPNAGILQQPLLLRLQSIDDCGDPAGETIEIPCTFEPGGLAGQVDNDYQERVDLQFKIFLPYVARREGEEGASLAYQRTVANANEVLQRSPGGVWSAMGTGAPSGKVSAMARGLDGKLYAGGSFPSMGGVANTANIAIWDPVTGAWSAAGTGGAGATNGVLGLTVGPDGSVIAVGDFTSMGGVANTKYIAKWNPTTGAWSSISSGATGTFVGATVFDATGVLYATGLFSNLGGVAAANIAKMSTAGVWSAIGTGLAGGATPLGLALARGPDGTIYVGGRFDTANGVNVFGIARISGSTFVALGTGGIGTGNSVTVLTFLPNGALIAGGTYPSIGGITAANIGSWNGVVWTALGAGVNGQLQALLPLPNGLLLVAGSISVGGGLSLPSNGIAAWTGSAWVYIDVAPPGSASGNSLAQAPDGTLYIGYDTAGSAVTAVTNTVTNSGSADAYPVFDFLGPGTVFQLVNYTTGDALYFNLILLDGERATLDLRPGYLSFVSTFRGDIAGTILPGSNFGGWHLAPGPNTVSAFVKSVSILTTLAAHWSPSYLAAEDALYTP